MSSYTKLIIEVLNELEVQNFKSHNSNIIIENKSYYITVCEPQFNELNMVVCTYDENDSTYLKFNYEIYPMQYYNFKEQFKLWYSSNCKLINSYFDYRERSDYE